MMMQHSCNSINVCEALCNTLVDLVGDTIQDMELEKLRRPCAAVMTLQATSLLCQQALQRHEPQKDLVQEDLDSEGAEEPGKVKPDAFQQHNDMHRYRPHFIATSLIESDSATVRKHRRTSIPWITFDKFSKGLNNPVKITDNSNPSFRRAVTGMNDLKGLKVLKQASSRSKDSSSNRSRRAPWSDRRNGAISEPASFPVKLEKASESVYKDNLQDEDFNRLRLLVAKRKEQRRKVAEAELAEKAKLSTRSKSGNQYMKLVYKANQPVNFTFNSDGQVMYKKKLDVERLPDQQKQLIEVKVASDVQLMKKEPVKKLDEVTISVVASQNNIHVQSGATIINSSSDKNI